MALRALTDDERDAALEASAPDLTLLAAQLHRCREDYRIVSEQYEAERRAFEEAHADLIRQCGNLHGAMEVADRTLREAAAEAYGRTGDKHPGPGLTIREHKRLAYDEWAALRWCKAEFPLAVVEHEPTLNRKVFEATAQALGLERLNDEEEADWIREESVYEVAIDRDLGKALMGDGQ